MRLLLDSHILLAIALKQLDAVSPSIARALAQPELDLAASAASLWEIAIKARLGKLDPGMPLGMLAEFFEAVGIGMLPITASHAVAAVEPMPPTRDPFDRMLLAQCLVEGRRLVTVDHALRDHPLAARFEAKTSGAPNPKSPKTRP
ncbi:type II toxin-antitoxin system VapC family toxin [Methylobacterium pseudosasicola]|uniref:PIN domain nuclease, a component of toxin-antitoxin system (PIN domain) n=1 Tax=Methylobacterium pseudosasicola TaxID=582667 RepID=A0A1I4KFI2_9HYPH|nr:type II toxin-antitoxin system VapC family toxin [Methylobacterium pseudosasicola]SFL77518.1 PIN domain nuclease, a component of toxin-antitoxin system (PIN domain) [Methylobacterium pseudosasicola]